MVSWMVGAGELVVAELELVGQPAAGRHKRLLQGINQNYRTRNIIEIVTSVVLHSRDCLVRIHSRVLRRQRVEILRLLCRQRRGLADFESLAQLLSCSLWSMQLRILTAVCGRRGACARNNSRVVLLHIVVGNWRIQNLLLETWWR